MIIFNRSICNKKLNDFIKLKFSAIAIVCILMSSNLVYCQIPYNIEKNDIPKAKAKLVTLANMHSNHEIKWLEITWVPDGVETFSRITISSLDNHNWYRLVIGDMFVSSYKKILPFILKDTKLSIMDRDAEYRTSIKWYDKNDKCIATLYIRADHHNCILDGNKVKLSPELYIWARDNFIYKITPPPHFSSKSPKQPK